MEIRFENIGYKFNYFSNLHAAVFLTFLFHCFYHKIPKLSKVFILIWNHPFN